MFKRIHNGKEVSESNNVYRDRSNPSGCTLKGVQVTDELLFSLYKCLLYLLKD